MNATMSKSSWFKRHGGSAKEPKDGPPSSSSPSKGNVFKAFRMGSGSLSSKSQTASFSSQATSAASYLRPLHSPSESSSHSPGLPLLVSSPLASEYPPSNATLPPPRAPLGSPTGLGFRPSQDDPFANLYDAKSPVPAPQSLVHFGELPTGPVVSSSPLSKGLRTREVARRRVFSASASASEAAITPSSSAHPPSAAAAAVLDTAQNGIAGPSNTGPSLLAQSASPPPSGSGVRYVLPLLLLSRMS